MPSNAFSNLECPNCGGQLEPLPDGLSAKCKHCGSKLVAQQATATPSDKDWDEDFEEAKTAKRANRAGIRCPFCGNEGMPVITKQINTTGWVLFILALLFCLPLCFIPFVSNGCKDEIRKCSTCGSKLS